MKQTDWRTTLEVVVKGLVGAVLVLAGLWVLGWLFSALGALLLGIAGIVSALLRFLIPVAAIAGIVYFIVAQLRPKETPYTAPASIRVEKDAPLETVTVSAKVTEREVS